MATVDVLPVVSAVAGEDGARVIIPVVNELIWGTLAFAVFFYFVHKYAWPNLTRTLTERTENIEGKLEQAEKDRAESVELLAQTRSQLDEARGEAARIRTEAQSQRAQIVDEARSEAQQEAAEVLRRGEEQLAAQRQQVVAELRSEVGSMAVQLASRIVGESLEDEERQRRTVDRFLAELEAEANGEHGGEGERDEAEDAEVTEDEQPAPAGQG